MRPTGFSPATKELIKARAGGRCERCCDGYGIEYHHRRPRGMGGSSRPDTNSVANGALLCSKCHRDVESHRTEALLEGWILLQIQVPTAVPVLRKGLWTYLLDDGSYDIIGVSAV